MLTLCSWLLAFCRSVFAWSLRAALIFSVILTSCSHDYRAAKQTLQITEIDSWAKPIQPEPLQFTPLIPRTESELERQAADEQAAMQTLKRLRFTE